VARLRKFMRGCFAYLAILYFGVGFGTIQSLFRGSPADHAHELSQQTFRLQLAVVLHEMTHLLPLVLAVLFARAWWSLRKENPLQETGRLPAASP
jgi:uncharacterized membrane protein YidH (DUF202 family)